MIIVEWGDRTDEKEGDKVSPFILCEEGVKRRRNISSSITDTVINTIINISSRSTSSGIIINNINNVIIGTL